MAPGLDNKLTEMWVISSLLFLITKDWLHDKCFEWGNRIQIVELKIGDLSNGIEERTLGAENLETKRKLINPQGALQYMVSDTRNNAETKSENSPFSWKSLWPGHRFSSSVY